MPKLGAATNEINAAFDKVYPELLALAERYSKMVNVPFVNVRDMVINEMHTPDFKRQVVQVINDAIDAAEKARGPASAPST